MMIENLSVPICIFRRDPSLNMARFYRVEILTDIFGQTVLERTLGRIGGRGQSLVVSYLSARFAEEADFKVIRAKEWRG